MRIAFAGLAHSHPYTDATGAMERGWTITGVADADPARRAEFAARFGCPERESAAALGVDRPDVVIATLHPERMTQDAAELAASGIPVFFNKCVAATASQFAAFEAIAGDAPIGTSSVLRFAPAIEELARRVDATSVLAVQVTAQHDNALFIQPERRWQDDPAVGGGTLVNVGVHAWELIDAVLPGAVLDGATGWSRLRPGSASVSEDAAGVVGMLVHAGRRVPVHAHITGLPGPDLYRIEVLTSSGIDAVTLDSADARRALGFDGLLDALERAAPHRQVPAPWARARTVVTNTILAASAARAAPDPGR